jgi:hypothetical protein
VESVGLGITSGFINQLPIAKQLSLVRKVCPAVSSFREWQGNANKLKKAADATGGLRPTCGITAHSEIQTPGSFQSVSSARGIPSSHLHSMNSSSSSEKMQQKGTGSSPYVLGM